MLKKKITAVSVSVQNPGQTESNGANVVPSIRASVQACEGPKKCTCGNASLIDALKQRIGILEVENRRLMSNQGHLVAETNRRVEMHISEVKGLKEELKKLQLSNKGLRDLCCFLDDDRLKTRRLSREWQKFGRYTSEVMKQEVRAYQAKLRELESRQQMLFNENDDLKKLCLYLDEQRQAILLAKMARGGQINSSEQSLLSKNGSNSLVCDSSGCGSSTGSQKGSEDEEDLQPERGKLITDYDDKQENTLRMITQQMQTSLTLERCSNGIEKKSCLRQNDEREDELLEYIQSLETRIRQLELTTQCKTDLQWSLNRKLADEGEAQNDESLVESTDANVQSHSPQVSSYKPKFLLTPKKETGDSTTGMMSSSGATYCNSFSDTAAEATVFVTGDEFDPGIAHLEVRTLGPINEEAEEFSEMHDLTDEEVEDNSLLDNFEQGLNVQMPPTIAPVSASVSRLSSSCCSDLSLDGVSMHSTQALNCRVIKPAERCSSLINLPRSYEPPTKDNEGSYVHRDSFGDAVKALKMQEMAACRNVHGLFAQETALVHHMCKATWDTLDRKTQSLINSCTESTESLKTQVTAV